MNQTFKTHISSKHNLLDLHIREAFQYRDLIFIQVKDNYVAQYKQMVLGPLWSIIRPLLTTLMMNIVFGNVAKLTRADIAGDFFIPSYLFYMSGNVCWGFFSSVLQSSSTTLLDNRGIMGKVYYPRIVAPISAAFSQLITFAIQFAIFAGIWIFFVIRGDTGIIITPRLLLIPVLIFHMMILAIGSGIIVASLTTKFRDMIMVVGLGLGFWRYLCPVAYGLQLIPDKYLGVYMLNPVSPIITTFRYSVFGFGYYDWKYYALSWLVSILVMFIGLIMFSRAERTFMDTI